MAADHNAHLSGERPHDDGPYHSGMAIFLMACCAGRSEAFDGILARSRRKLTNNLLFYRMPWDRRFGVPIALLDGRSITTLSDEREVLDGEADRATRRRMSAISRPC